MNIILASSEVVPFAKTGGLADVCGALPSELSRLGPDLSVFMPAYPSIDQSGCPVEPVGVQFQIPIGSKIVLGDLLQSRLPGTDVRVFFVRQKDYFDRSQLYGENGVDYPDNIQRFAFFCRAVLESIRLLNLSVDLIHANDWQTGLIPALLATEYRTNPVYENIATLLTIHNLAYQGNFPKQAMIHTGMDWKYFNWRQMEFYDRLNLLKTGIVFSDAINTVSQTYAEEIQTDEQGCGLQQVLKYRSDRLTGILNGIDSQNWNPNTDPMIATRYDATSWKEGKSACKEALQSESGLARDPDIAVIGIVGRLATQKGWSLILPIMERWLKSMDVQWVVLGTGQSEYHEALQQLQNTFPRKLAASLIFSNELAHRIEAGADLFLMPSEYEPCGLNQMYSMAYGTVPVVRQTGGLADTVVDVSPATVTDRTANGFSFVPFTSRALETAMQRALDVYHREPAVWSQIVETGMQSDWSWTKSARQYLRLYQQTIEYRKSPEKKLD